MSEIACLRCKEKIDSQLEQCPHCTERVTAFQRTYSERLLDGKYQILDRLGVGGMGEIFKVRHIHLNELRVIKIMRPNVAADDQGLQRFLQEARTSTMIKHQNLAMLYDFAQLEDGSYYMVWEFIDGTNIQRWSAQNGPMPARLSIEIAIQALHGLEHLHSMGLIHRDISPENIMLSQDHHGKLLVKVIDFGIAKQLAENESGGQGLTQTGMFLGKLKYASPEQAGFLKEGEHLDARSDLYSFGIVMYEMLAGKAPFVATNPHSYILKHVTEKPLPISTTNPAVKVPPQVESVVMVSLEKSRDDRYAGAADFAAALEAIRNTVAPDARYGLGERMITLSGAKTLADLPKFAGTASGATQAMTQGTTASQPTMGDSSTLIDRNRTPATMSDAKTVVERQIGGTEATLVERLGGSAPTAVEAKGQWDQNGAGAAPTVIERQIKPPGTARSRMPIFAAAAVALILVIAGIAYFTRRTTPAPAVPATPSVTVQAGAQAPAGTAAGQGALLLSASPWGDIEKIVNAADQKSIDFPVEAHSTPAKIDLAPGHYLVTIAGPNGTKTIDVAIEAGKRTPQHVDMGNVDVDELAKEMNP